MTPADLQRGQWAKAGIWLALLVAAAALLASPLRGHVDDTDAQLYQVLARRMAARCAWLEPGPAPGSTAPFREHLPFGLWPQVAAVRALGQGALFAPGMLFSLGTVALVFAVGARMASVRAGAAAALLLACTETFFLYGARPRLDPELVFFALAAAAPSLCGALRGRGFWLACAAGAAAVLIKGPFGLVPLAAAGAAELAETARAAPQLRLRGEVARLCLALALALLPVLAFLLVDRAGAGTWWTGYLQNQVLASAAGAREDGSRSALFPFATAAGRFWPGLPAALLGFWLALGLPAPAPLRPGLLAGRALRTLAGATALALLLLDVPQRKVWNHELVAFPLLALLAGAALDAPLRRLSRRAAALTLAAFAALACLFAASGLGARLLQPPCVGAREFAAQLSALPPRTDLLLAGAPVDWHQHAALAAEHDLEPWPVPELPPGPALDPGGGRGLAWARIALRQEAAGAPPPPWRVVASARGWQLLRR